MVQSDIQPGRLAVLTDGECWDLLRSQPVGRIAWSGLQGVSVVPVNFVVVDDAIILRTTPYSLLARDSVDREVAFQVDQLDLERHEGWSVLARGRTRREDRSPEHPQPWATGARVLGLRIDVRSVSGRRLLAAGSSGGGSTAGVPQSSEDVFFTA